ncbi:hypothetical protein Taro_030686 [Colocasia esculenta]|uniref:Uncharacterized protein n=1 Tax=Colocasia esculenta TaxID=4460 RepID=A0A843VUP7_COLES|nr:hypothetical protein [Colocasia esculenta]
MPSTTAGHARRGRKDPHPPCNLPTRSKRYIQELKAANDPHCTDDIEVLSQTPSRLAYSHSGYIEMMIQLLTPSLGSNSGSTPISTEKAFVSVMGKDRFDRVHCEESRETLYTWYVTGEGSSSFTYQQQISNMQDVLRTTHPAAREQPAPLPVQFPRRRVPSQPPSRGPPAPGRPSLSVAPRPGLNRGPLPPAPGRLPAHHPHSCRVSHISAQRTQTHRGAQQAAPAFRRASGPSRTLLLATIRTALAFHFLPCLRVTAPLQSHFPLCAAHHPAICDPS